MGKEFCTEHGRTLWERGRGRGRGRKRAREELEELESKTRILR